jgi:tyrosinase
VADIRKNQAGLSSSEWGALIEALDAVRRRGATEPSYRDFVRVHVDAMEGPGMHTWGVHTMGPGLMRGRNFLAWHRWYVRRFEQRLQEENPGVTIPYWNWISDRGLPRQLNRPAQLRRWRVRRQFERDFLPERVEVRAALSRDRFTAFQRRLEFLHGDVHIAVGGESGEMSTARSPQDPLFWLHHANVDRLWAGWQEAHPRKHPPNADEVLEPSSLFGVNVSEVLRIDRLGYRYR